MVAQQAAGFLVDKVDPCAGRAGNGFIDIRTVCRQDIRELNLNIDARTGAANDRIRHFVISRSSVRFRIDLAQDRRRFGSESASARCMSQPMMI
jgi:hypothetical protein